MIDRSLNYGRHLIADFLPGQPDAATILDIGAGSGDDLSLARQQYPRASLHAIEYWPPNIRILTAAGVSVHSLNIEVDHLPFSDRTVDIIIANQVLEHTKEIFWIFHEISRTLTVGGTLIVGVPNLASLHNRILLAVGKQPSPIKSASAHVRGFTVGDLLNFTETIFPAGYRLEKLGGSNFYPFPPYVARLLAKALPTFAWSVFLKLRKTSEYNGQFIRFPRIAQLETNFYVGPCE